MRIERHPAVIEDDLPGIYAHIARDDAEAAERVLDAVAETFEHISAQPEIGVLYPSRNPQMKGVRMLPVSAFNNYLVFYRIEGDSVRVAVRGPRRTTFAAVIRAGTPGIEFDPLLLSRV